MLHLVNQLSFLHAVLSTRYMIPSQNVSLTYVHVPCLGRNCSYHPDQLIINTSLKAPYSGSETSVQNVETNLCLFGVLDFHGASHMSYCKIKE